MFARDDTIVAVATPPGRGGLGVVRLSGPDAVTIAGGLLDREVPLRPRHATLARAVDRGDARAVAIDEVIAVWFPQPRSYTGEDIVEVSAHGSPVLLNRIVSLACAAGARLAEPGEFTLRAYLNGRLDLVQAEAVADLVDAVTPLQARLAFDQLEGTITEQIGTLHADLFDLIARLEASLDFPEEGYHFVESEIVAETLGPIRQRITELLAGAGQGRLIREGGQVVILGKPNVGKSSIFNALLGSSRAIVTPVAGTTRDLVTDVMDLDGVPVTLVDSAGIRVPGDPVEIEGVLRARRAAAIAAAVIVVVDRSEALDQQDRAVLEETSTESRVVAVNKVDQSSAWEAKTLSVEPGVSMVEVSARTGEGLDRLRDVLRRLLLDAKVERDTPAVANLRHIELLERARDALGAAAEAATAGVSEEYVLSDLQRARSALEELTGSKTTDDMLRHIFERFCIGK